MGNFFFVYVFSAILATRCARLMFFGLLLVATNGWRGAGDTNNFLKLFPGVGPIWSGIVNQTDENQTKSIDQNETSLLVYPKPKRKPNLLKQYLNTNTNTNRFSLAGIVKDGQSKETKDIPGSTWLYMFCLSTDMSLDLPERFQMTFFQMNLLDLLTLTIKHIPTIF